jgi:hypothetical protein
MNWGVDHGAEMTEEKSVRILDVFQEVRCFTASDSSKQKLTRG